jgi:hypothetical protein
MDELYENLASDVWGWQRGVYVLSTRIVGCKGVSIRQSECALGLSTRQQGTAQMQSPSDEKFGGRGYRNQWEP